MKESLSLETIASFAEQEGERDVILARRAVSTAGLAGAAGNDVVPSHPNVFDISIEVGEVPNQRLSGRCWMFAGLNVLRPILCQKLNAKAIELSESYLQFYDKLEKANFFLERELEIIDAPLEDRFSTYLRENCTADGGHWAMFVNLVKKYGVVPEPLMKDAAPAQNTAELNRYLHEVLCSDLAALRKAHEEGKSLNELRALKQTMMKEVYRILVIALGNPVKEFSYSYYDKDKKAITLEKMTPKQFYDAYIGEDLDDYVALCHAPTSGWKDYVKYSSKGMGNVIEGGDVYWFNIPLQDLKDITIETLRRETPIWFAADVGKESLRKEGYLIRDSLPIPELMGVYPHLTKAEKLDYGVCRCAHAMVFCGLSCDKEGKPIRYRVENSWGAENGLQGFYVMDDPWFDEYVHEIIVKKEFIKPEILSKFLAAETVYTDPYNTMWQPLD